MITISAVVWLTLAINALLPILVDFVTARVASAGLKATLLLFLSGVTTFLVAWSHAVAAGVPFDGATTGATALAAFGVALMSHFGLLAPTGVTGSDGAIQSKLPGWLGGLFGL